VPQNHNSKGADYDMPPAIISSLVTGTTWELWCQECPRFVAVDVIRLLEHYDPYDRVNFDRATCQDCGSKLKQTSGLVISALRYTGYWPKEKTLVVAGGGPWRAWRP